MVWTMETQVLKATTARNRTTPRDRPRNRLRIMANLRWTEPLPEPCRNGELLHSKGLRAAHPGMGAGHGVLRRISDAGPGPRRT